MKTISEAFIEECINNVIMIKKQQLLIEAFFFSLHFVCYWIFLF